MSEVLPFAARAEDEVELAVVDLGVARAFWEGVPSARLLARVRLDRDAMDADQEGAAFGTQSGWDVLLARLCGKAPSSLDRVKKGVARHARAASDEGALRASDARVAALVHTFLSAADADASPAEGAALAHDLEEPVRRACSSFDRRLGRVTADRRAAAFEACLELATIQSALPERFDVVARELGDGLVASATELYPWGESDVPKDDRRACLLGRGALERAIGASAPHRRGRFAAPLLARRGELVLFVVIEPNVTSSVPPIDPSSFLPTDFAAPDAARRLAVALERGATTIHRARAIVMRGGETALDQLGEEMLHAAAHPYASAAFAEILARAGRERDVVRLVGYFAIAPNPVAAARALSMSPARELPTVLRGWLESMLPGVEGGDDATDDPSASARARLSACIEALAPYPNLQAAAPSIGAKVRGSKKE
jgi:hypothetical protein